MLKLSDITKSFGERCVLSGVSLSLEKGDVAVLSGMSGGGKTTLLRIAAGLEKADSGFVEKDGTVAVVFAEARLFPSVSVLENVTCVMRGDKRENAKRAEKLLSMLGLSDAKDLYPREISSGMAARVSIARALAYDADIYLLDEPLKSLDEALKMQVMQDLKEFFKTKAVLIISHDEAEAEMLATVRYRLCDSVLMKIEKDEP
ncbi:MAG: ABC transporter ATP-binding protein [Clostridia bacterium]|nr:ABC transporter ATP-binding protein [Clostridia bacterium]